MSNERDSNTRGCAQGPAAPAGGGAVGGGGPLILGVDTATEKRSVAVARGGRLLALCAAGDPGARHSAGVLLDIEEALGRASSGVRDVDLFAAAAGPGSFTGLRAGLATIKALASTLSKPAVGVSTLHAVAYGARPARRLLALVPAGRGEVYAQLLSATGEGRVEELGAAAHLSPQALFGMAAKLGGGIKWAGPGVVAVAGQMASEAERLGLRVVDDGGGGGEPGEAEWVISRPTESLAACVAALALIKYSQGLAVPAGELRADYVRASDAELKEQCQSPGEVT